MLEKLKEILEIIENNDICILFKIKENKKMELIKLGYFKGNEDMIRVTKKGTTHTITIFYKNGESISYDFGSSTTLVSENLRQIKFMLIDYMKQYLNINLDI